MNYRIRRRRFGQILLASASAVASVFGKSATKTLAQEEDLAQQAKGASHVYGVSVVSGQVVLKSLDLNTGKINELKQPTSGLTLDANQRLTGFTLLTDNNTLALTTAPTTSVTTGQQTKPSSLSFLVVSPPTQAAPLQAQTVSPLTLPALPGLDESSTVESLLATNDGLPPPGAFVLPLQQRYSNLAQNSGGTIYATSVGREGYTSLIQIDLQKRLLLKSAKLSFNSRPLLNDLASLAFSPDGKLYALADPTYKGTNSLFTVDLNTGAMKLVIAFAVDKISFNRP